MALFCARRDLVYEDYSQFPARAFQGGQATGLQRRQKESPLKNYWPAPIRYRVGTSHVALPRTHHEEAANWPAPRTRTKACSGAFDRSLGDPDPAPAASLSLGPPLLRQRGRVGG